MKGPDKALTAQRAVRAVRDPVFFAREILHVEPQPYQEDILWSVRRNRDTGVPSCHASGKTFIAATACLDHIMNHAPGTAIAIVTSSDWEQVESQIFPEMYRQLAQSEWSVESRQTKMNETELHLPGGNYVLGKSTNKTTSFHGYHAQYILVVVDEFSGIDPLIHASMSGLRAGGHVRFLYLWNPTVSSGPSVDILDSPNVHIIRIDGLEGPNMAGYHIYENPDDNEADEDKAHNLLFLGDEELDADPFPHLITRRYIREMYEQEIRIHGSLKPESDWWPRVRGQAPQAGDSSLLQRLWVESANNRRVAVSDYQVAGLDVAGPGEDETTLCLRSGNQILREAAFADSDQRVLLQKIEQCIGAPRPSLWINGDRQGIGWYLLESLRGRGYQVAGLNAGDKPWDKSRFASFKDEMYWTVRAKFQDGEIGGPIDAVTRKQLLTIQWDQDNEKRLIHIESKKDARKRGVRSPDRAEALILSFAQSPTRQNPRDWRYSDLNRQPKQRGSAWIEKMRNLRKEREEKLVA